MGIWYATREDVMSLQDTRASAYDAALIDSAIESSSRAADHLLHRTLYPWTGTRYFDWPSRPASRTWRLWLRQYDLISVTSIANNDGTTIPSANVFLNPQEGPPYTSVEINQGTTSAFATGSTQQRAVGITGVYGYSNNETAPTALTTSPTISSTTLNVAAGGQIGVGSLLRIDSERMQVTDRAWLATADTCTLAAQSNVQAIAVSSGASYGAGERLLVDSEEMLIGQIAGNVLTVKRAQNGTTLAAHTSATIYASRTLTVSRGVLGTTAASHTSGVTVQVWTPPSQARELTRAYALVTLQGVDTAYQAGTGGAANSASSNSTGLAGVEMRAFNALGRKVRMETV